MDVFYISHAGQAARSAAQEERRASGKAAGTSGGPGEPAPASEPSALTYFAAAGLAEAVADHLQELADEVAVARLQACACFLFLAWRESLAALA